jgi:hypothetical protein
MGKIYGSHGRFEECTYKFSAVKPEGKRPEDRRRHISEDNIKMYLEETSNANVYWF